MEPKNNCGCDCDCDLPKINMDMTIKECLEKMGCDPQKAQEKLKECCKNCCGK